MSRRRYISTDISLDEKVADLAAISEFAALLYTWMIPHAEENATITASARRLRALVIPSMDHRSVEDVQEAVDVMLSVPGLFEGTDGTTLYFKSGSFYKYQTNVSAERRRTEQFIPQQHTSAQNSTQQHTSAQNAASLSLSPSPSLTPSRTSPCRHEPVENLDGIHPGALGKLEEKLGRHADPRELTSMRSLSKKYSEGVVCLAISQAFVQINEGSSQADNLFGLITTIAKGEVA